MRVLLVAPQQTDLMLQQDEVQRLVNVLNAKVVIGDVDCADVVDAINQHKPDVLWFSTHGDRDGIHLTNCLLDGDMLSSAIRGTNTSLVVLNSCDSRDVAERIYAATSCHVVATVGKVDDRHAFVTAQRFAVLLSTGLKPYEAFQKAKTPTFIYVPDMSNASHSNGNGYESLRRIVAEQQMEIDRLSRLFQQLTTDMSNLMLEFAKFRQDNEERFRKSQSGQWLLVGLVIIVLLVQLSQVLQ